MMETTIQKIARFSLAVLLLIISLNAFAGGYYGLAGAKDIPRDWLDGSAFKSFFIPSLILFTLIGGSCLATSILLFLGKPVARITALICGSILVIWIAVQVSVIGYVSILQPLVGGAGVVTVVLAAWLLRRAR